jgi:hypothetical protein
LVPFSTFKATGSGLRGLGGPATFRPQGLGTLSTVYAPATPASHFQAGGAPGVAPFGAFPSPAVPRRFRRTDPRVVSRCMRADGANPARRKRPARPLGFAPPESPSRPTGVFSSSRRRLLPWAFAFLGVARRSPFRLRRILSRAWRSPVCTSKTRAPQSINRRPVSLGYASRGAPSKVLHLCGSWQFERGHFGLCVRLASAQRYR